MLSMIELSVASGAFATDANTALITLLLKKCKDPVECTSYRPISLMNSDVKLFAKVLALRMEPFMNKLVHPDQTGSIR